MRELSLYVHIPFCVRKCLYCDFLSFPVEKKRQEIESYVNLLKQELRARAEACRDYTVKTVFFGGGTPSLRCHSSCGLIKVGNTTFPCFRRSRYFCWMASFQRL